MVFFLDILTSMNEGDSLVAINALTAEHWMLCYPPRSRSLNCRAVARTGNRCAALVEPARNRETWQASNTRTNAVIIQCKERHFLPGRTAGVSVPDIS
jgi:hypothetical protein